MPSSGGGNKCRLGGTTSRPRACQVLAHFERTRVLHFEQADPVTASNVLERLAALLLEEEGAADAGAGAGTRCSSVARNMALREGTRMIARADTAVPLAPVVLRAAPRRAVVGGKGGFGAMLRALGKSGGKVTKDFGACRDLNGRRLRHVNDEIKLQKWAELQQAKRTAKERGEAWAEPLPERTQSGLRDWHLATPSWIEGLKPDKLSRRERREQAQRRTWEQEEAEAAAAGVPMETIVGVVTVVDSFNQGFAIVNDNVYVPFNVNEGEDKWEETLKVGDTLRVVAAMKRQRRNTWRAVRALKIRDGGRAPAVAKPGKGKGKLTAGVGRMRDFDAAALPKPPAQSAAAGGGSDMASLVRMGLKAERQAKRRRLESEAASIAALLPAGMGTTAARGSISGCAAVSTVASTATGSFSSPSSSSSSSSSSPCVTASWVGLLAGNVHRGSDGSIRGAADFSSACVLGCALRPGSGTW